MKVRLWIQNNRNNRVIPESLIKFHTDWTPLQNLHRQHASHPCTVCCLSKDCKGLSNQVSCLRELASTNSNLQIIKLHSPRNEKFQLYTMILIYSFFLSGFSVFCILKNFSLNPQPPSDAAPKHQKIILGYLFSSVLSRCKNITHLVTWNWII